MPEPTHYVITAQQYDALHVHGLCKDAIAVEHHERLLLAHGYVEAFVVPEDDEDVYGVSSVPAASNEPVPDLMERLKSELAVRRAQARIIRGEHIAQCVSCCTIYAVEFVGEVPVTATATAGVCDTDGCGGLLELVPISVPEGAVLLVCPTAP